MSALGLATVVVVALAVLLGGGTRIATLGDVAVQVAATFLLFGLLLGRPDPRHAVPRSGWLVAIAVAAGFLLICQLFALPAAWVGALRSQVLPFELSSGPSPAEGWSTLTLVPSASWASAVSIVAPLAVFLAVSRLGVSERLRLVDVVLVLGAVACLLGLVQLTQGPNSSLRPFAVTNVEDAVGFFANRNHFAAQLYVTLLLAGAALSTSVERLMHPQGLRSRHLLPAVGTGMLMLALLSGLVMARSRAGVAIGMLGIVGILAIALMNPRLGSSRATGEPNRRNRIVVAVVLIAVVFAVQFGLYRLATRFSSDVLDDLRFPIASTTFDAAWAALPFGTGLGTFVEVYAALEPTDVAVRGYVNRAHNDLLELFLEAGLPGLVLLLLIVGWLSVSIASVWTRRAVGNEPLSSSLTRHLSTQRASSIAIVLVLIHSLVDYPLRSAAMSVLFAMCCGLLRPPARRREPDPIEHHSQRHPHQQTAVVAKREAWKIEGAEWPEAWRPSASPEKSRP